MTPQQEIDTLRVMLGKALGVLHDPPDEFDDTLWPYYDSIEADARALGIEPIGPPMRWEHPEVIRERERHQRIQQQRYKLMEDYGLMTRIKITREDILNDDLCAMPALAHRLASMQKDALDEAIGRKGFV